MSRASKTHLIQSVISCVGSVLVLSGSVANADNTDRYLTIRGALATAANPNNGWRSPLAGVAFDTAQTPIVLRNFDTPDPRAFANLDVTKLIFGNAVATGLGHAAWMNSAVGTLCNYTYGPPWNQTRTRGVVSDIRYYWWNQIATPIRKACATNMHQMYNEILRAVRQCGNRCFVDIASLSNIDVIRSELRWSIQAWAQNKPANAHLILRVTEGFVGSNGSAIAGQIDYFRDAVRAAQGRIDVYGMPLTSGVPAGGTWSHVKLFSVHDLSNNTFVALWGGENHWTDYDADKPPFDTNAMVTGRAATLFSMQLDGALEWFDDGRSWVGENVWFGTPVGGNQAGVHRTRFKWNDAPYASASFRRYSGFANVNPRTTPPLNPGQRAIVSLIDMGAYSSDPDGGRTISRTLHDLIKYEPRETLVRVFNQALVQPFVNQGPRAEQTPVGALVYRAMMAAMNNWDTNVYVLTSDSQIKNDGYPSAYSRTVRSSLYLTGEHIACTDAGQDGNRPTYQLAWRQLRFFNNERGNGSCTAGVRRAIDGRFAYRMAAAFINGERDRVPVGVHHKIVMFGRAAMFQGSFNLYASASDPNATFDSKLVENGAIILDPAYVTAQVSSWEVAWSHAYRIIDP
jgi:hypothetical protein